MNPTQSVFGQLKFTSSATAKQQRTHLSIESLESRDMLSVSPLENMSTAENTGEKPQSKVWEYQDEWWSALPDDGTLWLSRLDGDSWTRITAVGNSDSVNVDVKAQDDLVHIFLFDGSDSRLATLEYSHQSGTYVPWAQQPGLVDMGLPGDIETATIDIDSTGRMWVAYDQDDTVEVRYADGNYSNWSGPITVASGIGGDDISSIAVLPNGQIGVFWSNQSDDEFGFRTHNDGDNPATWSSVEHVSADNNFADDHLNVAVTSDGTMYVAIKTSYDSGGEPSIGLLVRRPNGVWDDLYPVANNGTRGIVVANEAANTLIVAYTANTGGGDIVYRESPLGQISFGAQKTLISGNLNDVTSTKQIVDNNVVFLASKGSTAYAAMYTFDYVPDPDQEGGEEGEGGEDPPVNLPHDVNAGPDQHIDFGQTAQLDGTVNDDGVTQLNHEWRLIKGPGQVLFGDSTAVDTTAQFSAPGVYTLRLTSTDGEFTDANQINIIVHEVSNNQPHSVNAGPDQHVNLGDVAQLDGTVLDDGATALSHQWRLIRGPGQVVFGDSTSVDTTAAFSTAGVYTLRLTSTDGEHTDANQINIIVHEGVNNDAPQVDAGPDQWIYLGETVQLDGTVIDDGVTGNLTAEWRLISGPGEVSFADSTAIDTTATFTQAGKYVLRLTANDGELQGANQISIFVEAPITTGVATLELQNGLNGYSGTIDTVITTDDPEENFGNNQELMMDGRPDTATLIAWDLTEIPAGSTITSVSMQFYVTNDSGAEYDIYALDQAWDELSATWEESSAGNAWDDEGATGDADHNGQSLGELHANNPGLYTYEFNEVGIDLVEHWIDNPEDNHGLIFQNYTPRNNLVMASSEAVNINHRPKLIIEFDPPIELH